MEGVVISVALTAAEKLFNESQLKAVMTKLSRSLETIFERKDVIQWQITCFVFRRSRFS